MGGFDPQVIGMGEPRPQLLRRFAPVPRFAHFDVFAWSRTNAPGLCKMLTSGTEEGQQCGALAIANIAANDSQNIFEIGESLVL